MVRIGASLLAADFARLGQHARQAERAGVDSLHLDIMDGQYVPNLALSPHHVPALRPYTSLPFSIHLEVENPDGLLRVFNPMGVETIIVQSDTCSKPTEIFALIRSQGAEVGLALNPSQALDSHRHLLGELDLLLILGVKPGFGGQLLHPETPSRIAAARALKEAEGLELQIGADGGIKPANAGQLIEAGADLLIAGTAIFQAADMGAAVRGLRRDHVSQTSSVLT